MGIFESYTYNRVYFVDLFSTFFIASVELSVSRYGPHCSLSMENGKAISTPVCPQLQWCQQPSLASHLEGLQQVSHRNTYFSWI